MKHWYRIIEYNPPSLETVDVLLGCGAVHYLTISDGIDNIYRTFIGKFLEEEVTVFRLKYGHMFFNRLEPREINLMTEKGYIKDK